MGLEYLLQGLLAENDLKILVLDQNNFEVKFQKLTFVEKFFVINSSVESLSMNECKIQEKMAIAIGKGLLKNT